MDSRRKWIIGIQAMGLCVAIAYALIKMTSASDLHVEASYHQVN